MLRIVRLEEIEPMPKVNVPHPKHQLKKYSTRQLKAWYEDCYLFERIAGDDYIRAGRCTSGEWLAVDTARRTRWDIDTVLQRRNVSHLELGRIQRLICEDVRS